MQDLFCDGTRWFVIDTETFAVYEHNPAGDRVDDTNIVRGCGPASHPYDAGNVLISYAARHPERDAVLERIHATGKLPDIGPGYFSRSTVHAEEASVV